MIPRQKHCAMTQNRFYHMETGLASTRSMAIAGLCSTCGGECTSRWLNWRCSTQSSLSEIEYWSVCMMLRSLNCHLLSIFVSTAETTRWLILRVYAPH
eukprot:scaffold4329_cov115-Cylindrotheca_fusiformis.AAC.2